MTYNIALLRGDGIGPEIVDAAVEVLEKVGEKFGHTFNFKAYLLGGAALDECGITLWRADSHVALAGGGEKYRANQYGIC